MNRLLKFENFKNKLFESNLVLSDQLISLLNSIPDNKIKDHLLNIVDTKKDININYNFFDISDDDNTRVTFTQDRKASEILGDEEIKYKIDSNRKRLTLNKWSDGENEGEYKNKEIFDALGFDPETMSYDRPNDGQVGIVLSKTHSREKSGVFYVLFKYIDSSGKEQYSCHNTLGVSEYDDRLKRIWELSRNPIKVGKGVRAILKSANVSFTDKELEEFVNAYKMVFDKINDEFSHFDIVSGQDISYWYNSSNYENSRSSLGNSCMGSVDDGFFDIYTENPKVCQLVILYSKNGQISDGRYKARTIRGRALLWKTDSGDMVMDRIYTNYDSDIELFKQFAQKNKWWYKVRQSYVDYQDFQRGNETKSVNYVISLDTEWDEYPYMDTFFYCDTTGGKLSNGQGIDCDIKLRDTDGGYDTY